MPEGQFSGDRAKYVYVSEDGTSYSLFLDVTLATLPNTGLVAQAPGDGSIPKPIGFKPRVVFWQGELGGRTVRKEIITSTDSTLYATSTRQLLEVDGVTGVTTGRRGEKLSF